MNRVPVFPDGASSLFADLSLEADDLLPDLWMTNSLVTEVAGDSVPGEVLELTLDDRSTPGTAS